MQWGISTGSIEKRPAFERYAQAISQRPACERAATIDNALLPKPDAPTQRRCRVAIIQPCLTKTHLLLPPLPRCAHPCAHRGSSCCPTLRTCWLWALALG